MEIPSETKSDPKVKYQEGKDVKKKLQKLARGRTQQVGDWKLEQDKQRQGRVTSRDHYQSKSETK